MNIQDYLHAIRERLGHLNSDERREALTEIESHLRADVDERMADGNLTNAQATAHAIEAFGEPREIAIAYDGNETVLRDASGDVLLRIARRTGRIAADTSKVAAKGAASVLKVVGIVALVAILVATVLAVGALIFAGNVLTAYQDDIVESVPRPVYNFHEHYDDTIGTTDSWEDTFQISSSTKEFRVTSQLYPDAGCATIELISPTGTRVDLSGRGCEQNGKGTTLTEQGTWKIAYSLTAYQGSIEVEVYGFEHA